MTNIDNTYPMPNVGCMLGMAYQKLTSRLATALADAGLDISVPEYLILRVLYLKNGIQQCEIADMIGKDKGAINRTVASMSRKGIVRTESVRYKCLRVFLTDKGHDIKEAVISVGKERHEALVASVTPGDMESFVNVLQTIIQSNIRKD